MCWLPVVVVQETESNRFLRVDGVNIVKNPWWKVFYSRHQLRHWLNPEVAICSCLTNRELLSSFEPSTKLSAKWWVRILPINLKEVQHRISRFTWGPLSDIKQTGLNSIRLPFHYKLFTNEDYMGMNSKEEGQNRLTKWLNGAVNTVYMLFWICTMILRANRR